MTFIADNTTALPDWVSIVQAGGTAGLTLALLLGLYAFMTGKVVSGAAHQREIDAKDREIAALRTEQTEARLFIRDSMMPVLTRTQDVLAKSLEERAWQERRSREKT